MGTYSETICKHRILFPSIQHLAWFPHQCPQGKQKLVKIAILGVTHWLKHRITRKVLKIDRYMLQALNCLSIHATYCMIVAGASPGETASGLRYVKTASFSRSWIMSKRICSNFFHNWVVYRSNTDTKQRAASLRQQSFLYWTVTLLRKMIIIELVTVKWIVVLCYLLVHTDGGETSAAPCDQHHQQQQSHRVNTASTAADSAVTLYNNIHQVSPLHADTTTTHLISTPFSTTFNT